MPYFLGCALEQIALDRYKLTIMATPPLYDLQLLFVHKNNYIDEFCTRFKRDYQLSDA